MTDLPTSWRTPDVPMDAPRPTAEWLTARVVTFLAHYFQPDEDEMVYRMRIADWRDDLIDLPREAIDRAMRDRRRSPDRTRPTIGEIREAAKSYTSRSRPRPAAGEPPFGPSDDFDVVSGDRAAELAAEVYGDETPSHVISLVEAIKRREREDQEGAA